LSKFPSLRSHYFSNFQGVCLAILFSGSDAIDTVSDFIYRNDYFGPESVFSGDSVNQVDDLTNLIFGSSANNGDKGEEIAITDDIDE
jgi:hypothetical protein